jgi:DNA-binding LytR/AlgR family response regulator
LIYTSFELHLIIILVKFVFMNCIIGADNINCQLLEGFIGKFSTLSLIGTFSDSLSAKSKFSKTKDIDLVFLDTEIIGTDIFNFLRSLDFEPNFIMISSSDQNALEAFDYNVVDFLIKPVTYPRFCKAIDKAIRYYSFKDVKASGDSEIFVKKGSSLIKLRFNDIIYIEALENYVILNTKDEKYIIHFTMKAIVNQLPSKLFIRVHRSFIVNKNYIQTIDENFLELNIGREVKNIIISKFFRDSLMSSINLIRR